MTLAKARMVNYDRNCSLIVLATVIMIVNYDHHLFIVQATGNCHYAECHYADCRGAIQNTCTELTET
jgi:hypothetical protein